MGADFKMESGNHFSSYDCAVIIEPLGLTFSQQWPTGVRNTTVTITSAGFHQLCPRFISEESSEAMLTKSHGAGNGRLKASFQYELRRPLATKRQCEMTITASLSSNSLIRMRSRSL